MENFKLKDKQIMRKNPVKFSIPLSPSAGVLRFSVFGKVGLGRTLLLTFWGRDLLR